MLYHLFIKYFYLFKNISAEKFILICSFLASGIYGMIDVSYFFINYMILFIVIVVLCDDIYQDNHRTLKKQFKKFFERRHHSTIYIISVWYIIGG